MTADTYLTVYEDQARGIALIRGRNVRRVLASACVSDRARWSESGKGFVVPISAIADVVAMAEYENTPCRIKTVETSGGAA